ncbi:MAG: ribonuclease HII [Balneolaceae bacterium]|nr:MAG: ribonuclease HII [Balneolaceae bacterium]
MADKLGITDRYFFEDRLWAEGYKRIMGLDEVGRGCLCGPVVAAGVILKQGSRLPDSVRDSKTISVSARKKLTAEIKDAAIFYTIKECSAKEIDQLNILRASITAMMKCVESSGANPDYLLIDGNRFTNTIIPHQCIVKGDDKSTTIAAASILAKVYRDEYMERIHEEYPQYGWSSNVGYPTKKHFKALHEFGYTEHHRTSFRLRTQKKYIK